MNTTNPIPQSPLRMEGRPPASSLAEHVVEQWPRVRISDVTTRPSSEGSGDYTIVHARVHLGALLPADVRVELVPMPVTKPAAAQPASYLMWSVESYHNDSYAYEVTVPAPVLAAEPECIVCVRPASMLARAVKVAPVLTQLPCRSGRDAATRIPS